MVKVRLAGNRLSVGSWSIPYRSESQKKRQSRNFSAPAVPVAKDPETSGGSTNGDQVATPPRISTPPPDPITDQKTTVPKPSLVERAKFITTETEKLEAY